MALAIFDLDNTLLGGDSDHAWGQFLVDHGIVDAKAYQQANDYFYQQYQQGGLDIQEFLAFSLKPLASHSKQQLDQWHQQFMLETIAPMRLPKADALLQQHRDRGDFLLIITATNLFVTAPIAASLGVDHILATIPEFIDGTYTGKVEGTPCFQQGKVERLQTWLANSGHTLAGSYFYSDSHNDLPLLEMVEHPYAVDADDILTQHANKQGWPIISLR
ncbi:HAD family phosphatase [Oceanicoccus sp. KOV_DT_Chl]|uniref:histidinol-phosphatase n=1 Tax=Oceanicoccus sp. KOV_DT_Chl TaxID=1904639 RepID=UPI000C7DC79E|nr:HAD family hydrolase [Oceanicoccus sp. KOV_DT_Chl]